MATLTRTSAGRITPAETIQERFERFDKENPEVYVEVVRLAFILLRKHGEGKVKWVSISAIWERMRSNFLFEGNDASGYKLNNIYRSRYARKLIADYPQFGAVIQVRELQSQ